MFKIFSKYLIENSSVIIPHCSFLTPYSLLLAPCSLLLAPYSLFLNILLLSKPPQLELDSRAAPACSLQKSCNLVRGFVIFVGHLCRITRSTKLTVQYHKARSLF